MNSSGKVLTIFIVIVAILLISLTAISLFFFQQETQRRKLAETTLEEFRSERSKLEEELKDVKKQNFLLQEKNKEADERVNDLSDELELEKGLREEMKAEAAALQKQIDEVNSLKEDLAQAIQEKEELEKKLTEDIEASGQKIKELEAQLAAEQERSQKLGKLYEENQEKMTALEEEASAAQEAMEKASSLEENVEDTDQTFGVELGEIVVVPGENVDGGRGWVPDARYDAPAAFSDALPARKEDGRVLSVDVETEFVIISLGEIDGLKIGDVLSVYRNGNYVGDIRVTRLQPEMAAADLIPPFSIESIKKNDQVKAI
jgi:hypothetical protein